MEALLRALLLFAPPAYRTRYGDSVIADFRTCIDEARRFHRPLFPVAIRITLDLLGVIVSEHFTSQMHFVIQAYRRLTRTPLVTLAMIGTLAIGIGANVAGFTIVKGVLLNPLPFPHADRIVAVFTRIWLNNVECTNCSSSLFTSLAYRDQNSTFTSLAAYNGWDGIVWLDRQALDISGAFVGSEFLDVLGMRPELGRGFARSDERASTPDVAMLSDAFWTQHFNRSPSAIGQVLVVGGKPVRIIGILPRSFVFPNFTRVSEHPAIFFIAKDIDLKPSVGGWGIIGRLKPGMTSEQASHDLDRIIETLANTFPTAYRNDGRINRTSVRALADDLFRPMRIILLPLFGAVVVVLLIACINVSNLLVARTVGRQRDLAVRLALGAPAGAVIYELLIEALLLALAAACLGLAGAYYAVHGYAALHPSGIYRTDQIAIDGGVILYATGVAGLCAAGMSVLPAVIVMRGLPFAALKDGRGQIGTRGSAARASLVVVQIGCAFALVVACGLLVRSLQAYENLNLGFDTTGLVAIEPAPISNILLPSVGVQAQYFERLQQNLAALPGVAGVAYANAAPISNGEPDQLVNVVRGPQNADGRFAFISPGYFAAMGVPVIRGRAITREDSAQGRAVAVVNEEFVRRFLGSGEPIGRQFAAGSNRFTIVGVVPTIAVNLVGEEPQPAMYFAISQLPALWNTSYDGFTVPFVVRLRLPPATMHNALLSAWRAADPREPLPNLVTVEQLRDAQTSNTRDNAFVLAVLGAIALLLAISGTASIAAYSAAQRTSEIGVRMVLGATRWDIVNMLTRSAARLLGAGLAIGLVFAAIASYELRPQLFGTPPFDPATFGAVTIILSVATIAASLVPAYRAASVDPSEALRYE